MSNFPIDTAVGFWSPATANHDFCEKNYVYTYYIAEFWNTLSALLIVYVGFLCSWRLIVVTQQVEKLNEERRINNVTCNELNENYGSQYDPSFRSAIKPPPVFWKKIDDF